MATKNQTFLDTNVLVYQFDRTTPAKQKRAKEIVEQCILDQTGVISSQVIQEFTHIALKKFKVALPPEELEVIMVDVLEPMCTHFPTFEFYKRALKIHLTSSTSYYDSLIIQAALDIGCKFLYNEDLQDGRQFGSLTVKNPFV